MASERRKLQNQKREPVSTTNPSEAGKRTNKYLGFSGKAGKDQLNLRFLIGAMWIGGTSFLIKILFQNYRFANQKFEGFH